MPTARQLFTDALRDIGAIGMNAPAEPEDAAHMLRLANRMLDAWLLDNLAAYHVVMQSVPLTSAMQTRTIGTGGDVNVARPVRVEIGSYARVSEIDQPIEVISRDRWASIAQKTLVADRPQVVYYEASSPLGVLHFWPQGACTAYLAIQTQLSQFADLTTNYTLPPGYEDAIVLSLAERACRPFTRPMPASLPREAAAARHAIRLANFEVPEIDVIGHSQLRGIAGFNAG